MTAELQPPQVHRFDAMGCACEVLLDTADTALAGELFALAEQEARRIEAKYSRYRSGSVIDQINRSAGRAIEVDDETAALLDYAARCYELSGGLFDITTGILRKAWTFDGGAAAASPAVVGQARSRIGWEKVAWMRPWLQIPSGFEIDFGGICKEYAADRILNVLVQRQPIATLVNLGGDIAAWGERTWVVGIEDAARPGAIACTMNLTRGAVATSGTTKRFARVDGKTLGHILNPKTGWPVEDAPQSVTVSARTCTEAGFWSTLAILRGAGAESFLKEQSLEYWCFRPS